MERYCLCCGVIFTKKQRESISQWEGRLFCSKVCANRNNAKRKSIDSRFWEKVKKRKNSCWEWTGAKDGRGYGILSSDKGRSLSPLKAHRVSWKIHFGDVPKGLVVCHLCDNPECVNPDHLVCGTQKANMVDASRKNRLNQNSLKNLVPGSAGAIGACKKTQVGKQNGQ